MPDMFRPLPFVLLLGIAGCAADAGGRPATGAATPAAPGATAMLVDGTGAPRGTARIDRAGGGLRLTADLTGLPPGVHGIHLHTTGRCDGPDFQTAGGHWNPAMKMHGSDSANGPHAGDLPNVTIAADGSGHYEATLAGATLTGGDMALLDADGAALVVHAAADDYRTDPSGNSGARIACGVVTAG